MRKLENFDTRSSETIRRTKSWFDRGSSLALSLQRGITL